MVRNYYNPWTKPASSDCLNKTYYLTKYGIVAGAYATFLDLGMYTKPSTLLVCATRFGHHVSLLGGAAATYASALCIIGNVRKTDDMYNHFLAGLAAGSIFGGKYNSQKVGWGVGLIFGTTAMLIKMGQIEKWRVPGLTVPFARPMGILNQHKIGILTERPHEEGKRALE
ncbi:hypothetical protein SNE40_012306 [Patella caerulea]|uniref:NADH dehydrogenase [ubiquinone] 1 alpha subcomplex subunit 11 n=1 Tax=Patella caerulea TaxID=87958 RepID=A0AAN8JS61_PATCE